MARIVTVSALNGYVKAMLEGDDALQGLAVRGEISNFTNHFKTGHFFFTLKDGKCAVKAVMFQRYAQRLGFMPENGMRVIVIGSVSLFERDGAYQLYVEEMIPDGIGAVQAAFEQLKDKLAAEGLFAPEHKKPLPAVPQCVGLVTSRTGAALQDILTVTSRRYPFARFLLAPVTVQGAGAAREITDALQSLDRSGRVDVIIVARGGGAKEDLWVFNDEGLARAAYACRVPVVSAIGHEIDFTILDFVADLRAPTPSAAAELVMPDLAERLRAFARMQRDISDAVRAKLAFCEDRVRRLSTRAAWSTARARPENGRSAVAKRAGDLQKTMHGVLLRSEQTTGHRAALCQSLSPYGVLARGYSIARLGDEVLRSTENVRVGDAIHVQLSAGMLGCTVNTVTEAEL